MVVPQAPSKKDVGVAGWGKWYQPGPEDKNIYDEALRKCKNVNTDLRLGEFDIFRGTLSTKILESTPVSVVKHRTFTADTVSDFVAKEQDKVRERRTVRPEWKKAVADTGFAIAKLVTRLKPMIDSLLPQSAEYTVPYGCLMMIFQGAVARRDKKDVALKALESLCDDLPIFELYTDLFPTNEMKIALATLYIHVLDLLWRLARYFSLGVLAQLCDAVFPREKFIFSRYTGSIRESAAHLKTLCDAGHVAEQKSIKMAVDNTSLVVGEIYKDLQTSLNVTALGLQNLRQSVADLEISRKALENAQSRHYVSDLIDIWSPNVGAVEYELHLWQKLSFTTDPRDHWTQNGILPCIVNWRKVASNSILWICSENYGRQSWMTEFSLDLIRVCRSQGQLVSFALCDRPKKVRWTPVGVMKQLICQLLHQHPQLVIEEPEIFDTRLFRQAKTFKATFRILESIVSRLENLLIIIDRLELCQPDAECTDQRMVESLSKLARKNGQTLKVIMTTGEELNRDQLAGLAISFARIDTARRPHRRDRYVDKKKDNRKPRGRPAGAIPPPPPAPLRDQRPQSAAHLTDDSLILGLLE